MQSNSSSTNVKPKAFMELPNVSSDEEIPLKTETFNSVHDFMPCLGDKEHAKAVEIDDKRFQNVFPLLSWYINTI